MTAKATPLSLLAALWLTMRVRCHKGCVALGSSLGGSCLNEDTPLFRGFRRAKPRTKFRKQAESRPGQMAQLVRGWQRVAPSRLRGARVPAQGVPLQDMHGELRRDDLGQRFSRPVLGPLAHL
eukprot:CAMPEP_0172588914 /NCGR_PEP_ID=MMETSP1068-20121228/7746_1 /TAXON_ID=35684 /ORGANISM="Pseudopedinella elastica, Strain CCMP716" /LENGTH=122 /DNA_ID=CAMNT_0013384381 /DNA_START=272 /DNA_END=640 /DNA_ORIENTATION=-